MDQFREEEDLLGCMTVGNEYYYGIHTAHGHISKTPKISHQKISDVPAFIQGLHHKKAAALAIKHWALGTGMRA